MGKGNKKNKKVQKHRQPIKLPARISFLSYLGDVQGCGTIRVIHPYLLLNHYKQKGIQIHTQYMSNFVFEPEFYKNFTFCQFQRSATENHFKLFAHFKQTIQKKVNIPLIYEIDDMLIDIPSYNYASEYYSKNEDWVKKCMSICDGMVVSTSVLKERYSEYCKNITIVPNHLPKFIWGDVYPAHEYYEEGTKIKILWSGSQNHFSHTQLTPGSTGGDFGRELLNFIRKTTDKYDWYFVGAIPQELNDIKPKLCHVPWKYIFEYPKCVKDIEPDIAIAPLIDNSFNACKSNIKMLEFTAMGAAGVYSDVEPYSHAAVKAKDDEEMIASVEALANSVDLRKRIWKRDYAAIGGQLWWEENNNLKNYINSYMGLFGQKIP